jgi:hypothetical protein
MTRTIALRSLALLLCGMFFLGCGTLPSKPRDKSIVVIGIKNNKKDFDKYYVYFRLYYTTDDYIRIDPTSDRIVKSNIEPGDYEITAIQPVYFRMNQPYKKTETSIRFSCYPNGITILKDAVKISFESEEEGYITEHAEFTTLSDDEYEDLVRKIESDKNAKYWEVLNK